MRARGVEGSLRAGLARHVLYVAAGIVAAVVIAMATDTAEPRVAAVVTAVATIALAAVAAEALIASRQQALEMSRAVDATVAATLEHRRQSLLASLPFLRMSRPTPTVGEEGLEIIVPVGNLGPGHALEVVLHIEVRDKGQQDFRQPTVASGWPRAVVGAGELVELRIDARDLRNLDAPAWHQVAQTDDGQTEVAPPPNLFLPDVIQVRVRWLSTFGARAEQAYLWETGDFSQVLDKTGAAAWTWRFDWLALDPGAEGLEGVRFARPDA